MSTSDNQLWLTMECVDLVFTDNGVDDPIGNRYLYKQDEFLNSLEFKSIWYRMAEDERTR